ncbi:hypothetical protein COW36_18135 [bacterium (Candidatus Blackallbacteria) CG17_big_fil_post_rev_8_21_14_2_50_48_46]|uniref:Uncharacterized protein n=1 Tax=bacterium (Candidatus Blackallbacteria) CG17_big_fil_post_rev_8_21_14_2_50_48_46 TaxID=2014261 RepID=A0A2M7G0U0_9BACT|nr:MAG: hypothetical protein COW64_00595 [bacterium (Candidatus Blackallbacteria) CG18_big_fil_WC_8_21_14_2_50_49_26]PIW15335.1 MAG: hypothetical protein COW36_18135 [bacterium (Candidatus Blackallbacteria) CG17_big_fil_post_rev_8_21_14_2_50_48_46]PIW49804.1 MAG: hypothetical protein COW20_05230 [bacterium (Candidatus Blackallbacteria) CG13_big_fil_rev_8_21_14_2_50_49_14]
MSLNYAMEIAFAANKANEVYQKLLSVLTEQSRAQFKSQRVWEPCKEISGVMATTQTPAYLAYGFKNPESDSECLKNNLSLIVPISQEFQAKLECKKRLSSCIELQKDQSQMVINYFHTSMSVGKKWGNLSFLCPLSSLSDFLTSHSEAQTFFVEVFSDCAELIWFDYKWDTLHILFPQDIYIENFDQEFYIQDTLEYSTDAEIEFILENYRLEQKMKQLFQIFSSISKQEFIRQVPQDIPLNTKIGSENLKSLLDLAIEFDRLDLAYYLVEKGIELNYVNREGWTSAIIALNEGHYDFFQFLIQRGAQLNLDQYSAKIIFKSALKKKNLRILDYLFEVSDQCDFLDPLEKHLALRSAQANKNIEMAQYLSKLGISATLSDALVSAEHSWKNIDWALYFWQVIDNDWVDVLQYLFEKTQDLTQNASLNRYTDLLLQCACSQGSLKNVVFLLEKGYKPDMPDRNGKTAFMCAEERLQWLTQELQGLTNTHPHPAQAITKCLQNIQTQQKVIINLLNAKK